MRLTRLLFCALLFCTSFVSLHVQSMTTATVLRPYITSIFPQSLLTGADSTVLTINGKRFQRGAAVYFNARKLTNVRIDGDSVRVVVIPAELTVNADMAVLLVENPDETKVGLRVSVGVQCSSVGVSPSSTFATLQAFQLWITGTDITPETRISLDGRSLIVVSQNLGFIKAIIPAEMNISGTRRLQVFTSNGCTDSRSFTSIGYEDGSPAITRVTPSILLPNSGNVTIIGTNFSTGVRVFLGSVQLTIVSSSTTRIVVTVPTNLPFGSYTLSVVNPGWQPASQRIIYGLDNVFVPSENTTLSPNPVTTALTLETTLDRAATLTLTLRNILGEAVLQEHHTIASGRFTATLDVSTLANGVYLLEMSDGAGGRWVQKVVKY
ncbi:MAG: IPT/TIG domain-containing protein [Candidatus Kapabacteria bacterium]|nr:IPT/TIG domain-containing protein [Candidatus Kapabacteria bacterium]